MRLLLCSVVLAAAGGLAAAPPAVAPPPREARPAAPARPPLTHLTGEMTAVDGRSITVRGFGLCVHHAASRFSDAEGMFPAVDLAGGPLAPMIAEFLDWPAVVCLRVRYTGRDRLDLTLPNGEVMPVRRGQMPARRFPAGRELAGGGADPRQSPGFSYRLADVRVGDEVTVLLRQEGGADVCRAVSIQARPGGRVPPAPGDDLGRPFPWHVSMNALQDWQDHGIPLPYELSNRAAYDWYLERQRERAAAARTAPMPREAQPKPPAP